MGTTYLLELNYLAKILSFKIAVLHWVLMSFEGRENDGMWLEPMVLDEETRRLANEEQEVTFYIKLLVGKGRLREVKLAERGLELI